MKTNHSSVLCFGLVLIAVMFSVSTSFALMTGTVTDTMGSPVSGVLVTFTDESNPENEFEGSKDNDGRYEIPHILVDFTEKKINLHLLYMNLS